MLRSDVGDTQIDYMAMVHQSFILFPILKPMALGTYFVPDHWPFIQSPHMSIISNIVLKHVHDYQPFLYVCVYVYI